MPTEPHHTGVPDTAETAPAFKEPNDHAVVATTVSQDLQTPVASKTVPELEPPQLEPSRAPTASGILAGLVGSARGIAVIDVETTGLGHSDRVVEIAIVTLDHTGEVRETFETLINPHRDVGPTSIHGLTASMLADAPSFGEIAEAIAARLDGVIVAAHNIGFDTRMIGQEFRRTGIEIDWGAGLDTLAVTHCKLGAACHLHGIDLADAHRAVADATATAQLVVTLADRFPSRGTPAVTGIRTTTSPRILVRDSERRVIAPTPYLVELARDIRPAVDVASYVVLLDEALADLKLTDDERTALQELAADLGLSPHDIARAHLAFVTELIDRALDDSIVTDDELDTLVRVAALLNLDPTIVTARTNQHRMSPGHLTLDPGLAVCFTGDADTDGRHLSREQLHAIASDSGLIPVDSVTAKRCDLLVAVEPAPCPEKRRKHTSSAFPSPPSTTSSPP